MKKIYVGNLPYRTNESEVEDVFAKFGKVESVRLIKDRETDRLKGFGFVEFETNEQANAALEMNGEEFQGRPLKVSLAREQQRRAGGHGDR